MSNILAITAAQRLDSRGNPTVQVQLETSDGLFRSIVPSGASKGDYEAVEARDGDESEYHGKAVHTAVHNVVEVLGPAVIGQDFKLPRDAEAIDHFMIDLDGTEDKHKMGANAILGISMCVWRAAAAASSLQLYEFISERAGMKTPYVMPVPFFNVLNGGVHSGNTMAFQECMICPVGANSITQAVQMGSEVYATLKEVIKTKYGGSATGIGDEGGFTPPISKPTEAFDLLAEAIEKCAYTDKVKFGMDPAASEFFDASSGTYDLAFKNEHVTDTKSAEQMSELYLDLIARYPLVLLEDPFAQDDWQAWSAFCKRCSISLVGDDLLATNKKRIAEAYEKQACNSLLLKINQIGTITESMAAAKQAYSYGWSVFVSHRSGETTDDFIADLTVGLRTGHLKSGSPCRGERVAKYNRLMDIEDRIKENGETLVFAGSDFKRAATL